jgi:hypothetical protein
LIGATCGASSIPRCAGRNKSNILIINFFLLGRLPIMGVNGKTELDYLIPEIWSAKMYQELRNDIMFANLFSREYEGEIKALGDTVKVQQIVAPTGEIITDDKAQFNSSTLQVNQLSIVANKRASAAFEFTDLAQLQSLAFQADAQEALVYAIRLKLENDIIAALLPSTSSPDHTIAPASASDLAAADLGSIRTLLSAAKVPVSNRYLMLAPSYYGDLLSKTQVTSADFVSGGNSAQMGVLSQFMGFQIAEHNLLSADVGYAVHPSAMQLVMQQEIRIKISDLHSQNKYGYLLSADMVYGFSLFDNKRIVQISG